MRLIALLILSAGAVLAQDNAPAQILKIHDCRYLLGKGATAAEIATRQPEIIRVVQACLKDKKLLRGTSIEGIEGSLLVRGVKEAHRAVEIALVDMARCLQRQFLVKVRVLRVSDKLLPPHSGIDSQDGGSTVATIGDSELAKLLKEVKNSEHGATISSPSILANPFAKAQVSIGHPRCFVESYELKREVEGYPQGLYIPKLKVVEEGITITTFLMPHDLSGKFIGLHIALRSTALARPPKLIKTPAGPTHEVVIRTREVATLVTIPKKQHVLIDAGFDLGPEQQGDAPKVVIIVDVTLVP